MVEMWCQKLYNNQKLFTKNEVTITTNTKVNSCFAIFLNSEIKELKKIILTFLLLQQLQYLQV